MTATEVLKKGLENLRTFGWVTDTFIIPSTRQTCALGALGLAYKPDVKREEFHAVETTPLQKPPVMEAIRILASMAPEWKSYQKMADHDANCHRVANHNNGQTDFKVIEAWFERAIEQAEAADMYRQLAQPAPEVVMTAPKEATECATQSC